MIDIRIPNCVTNITVFEALKMEICGMKFFQKNLWSVAGVALGAIAGFSYYYFVGCKSGTCAITSSPVISSVYGGLMGFFLAGTFKPAKKENGENEK